MSNSNPAPAPDNNAPDSIPLPDPTPTAPATTQTAVTDTTANPTPAQASTGTAAHNSVVDQVLGLAQTAEAVASLVDPKAATIIALVNGLIDLIEEALPTIDSLIQTGALTAEQANQVRARWNDFASSSNEMFDQPQWQVQQ